MNLRDFYQCNQHPSEIPFIFTTYLWINLEIDVLIIPEGLLPFVPHSSKPVPEARSQPPFSNLQAQRIKIPHFNLIASILCIYKVRCSEQVKHCKDVDESWNFILRFQLPNRRQPLTQTQGTENHETGDGWAHSLLVASQHLGPEQDWYKISPLDALTVRRQSLLFELPRESRLGGTIMSVITILMRISSIIYSPRTKGSSLG